MFLESLIIKDVFGNNIRSVKFNPNGLNLIVGIPDKDGSTNNIGKTTLIRCIDFCLGGKIEQLYKDKEFKTINDDIFSFLIKKQPYFEIILSNSIQKNIKYKILRKIIYKHERKDFSIEDQIWSNDTLIEGDFKQKLKEIYLIIKMKNQH
ncbi:AAA family ATPase [Campylobacter upsaliensis]|nr:AAA family ATPase [Campylobacter upsaliensis]